MLTNKLWNQKHMIFENLSFVAGWQIYSSTKRTYPFVFSSYLALPFAAMDRALLMAPLSFT